MNIGFGQINYANEELKPPYMIWERSEGESFGLSIADFSTLNKPVIASKIGNNKGDFRHVELLGDK